MKLDLSAPLSDEQKARLLARLEAQTTKTDTCWLFTGYRRNGKHGAISVHDRPVYVHQLSYAINKGPIPKGVVIRHGCDVSNCWRPEHLTDGTQLQNIGDMIERGRAVAPPRIVGERHHKVTLSDAQVAEIRRRWAEHPADQRALGQEYGVSQSTIWRLVHAHTRATA